MSPLVLVGLAEMGEAPSLAVGAALAHLAPPIWSYERAPKRKKKPFMGKQELVAFSKAALKVATQHHVQ